MGTVKLHPLGGKINVVYCTSRGVHNDLESIKLLESSKKLYEIMPESRISVQSLHMGRIYRISWNLIRILWNLIESHAI